MQVTPASAQSLLVKLRAFARELDADERAVLGALVAPTIARAFGSTDEATDLVRWGPTVLPEALAEALRSDRAAPGDLGAR